MWQKGRDERKRKKTVCMCILFACREYWNNPAATNASFADGAPDSSKQQQQQQTGCGAQGAWFKTGDIVSVDARTGHFSILGRASQDIIKSGGYKLSALEIESALLEAAPFAPFAPAAGGGLVAIEECAVVALPDPVFGERVAAVCVLKGGDSTHASSSSSSSSTSSPSSASSLPAAAAPTAAPQMRLMEDRAAKELSRLAQAKLAKYKVRE